MENKRKIEGCPIHETYWLCRDGENVLCVAAGCVWKHKSKRETDKQIRTLKDCKTEFNG
jgi:hypothetical protein